jgi:hypothetical protein
MPDEMRRYKSAFIFRCVGGHENLMEDRSLAKSADEARNFSQERLIQQKCRYCDHTFNGVSHLGTEQISLHPEYQILGYVCKCGERVSVLKEETERQINLPAEITVECSRGHSRRLLNHELLALERWEEKTN